MSKSDDAKMAKLIRKNVAKAEKKAAARGDARRVFDATLQREGPGDSDHRALFAEMKKREF